MDTGVRDIHRSFDGAVNFYLTLDATRPLSVHLRVIGDP